MALIGKLIWAVSPFLKFNLSPLSFHSTDQDNYTSLATEKYSVIELFTITNTTLVLKKPYLRESFAKVNQTI